jgi:hypothetical protein
MRRRDLLLGSAGLFTAGALAVEVWSAARPWRLPPYTPNDGWDAGVIAHILPTASDTALRLSVSLKVPQNSVLLRVGNQNVAGVQTDSAGQHWLFDATSLAPETTYLLQLFVKDQTPLCAPWPLKTLPSPESQPTHMRLLVYTCAGGSDLSWTPVTGGLFQPSAVRSRLLARGIAHKPDVIIANGDHIYWDLDSRYGLVQGRSLGARLVAGEFDRHADMKSTRNEDILKKGAGPQIAGLYGTMMRSTPVWFLADDHDYFENDEWKAGKGTFPPDTFHQRAAKAVQELYYPKPIGTDIQPDGTASLRFGKLVDALLYDCREHVSISGDTAHLIAPEAEAWLIDAMATSNASHVVNVPGLPIVWTAGKWMEWYGDSADGKPKAGWAHGWRAQHDRLVSASTRRPNAIPLWLNGDLHCSAVANLTSIDEAPLTTPALAVLCGTIGTAASGFPSRARGVSARPALGLSVTELVKPLEKNGFAIIDFTPNDIEISLFGWGPEDGLDAIASLEPFWRHRFMRPH